METMWTNVRPSVCTNHWTLNVKHNRLSHPIRPGDSFKLFLSRTFNDDEGRNN